MKGVSTELEHSANGTAAAAPVGPRMPRRDAWVDLPEEYPGFRIRLWTNYPKRLQEDLASDDNERVKAALCQIVFEHNGWQDFDGQPIPPASSPDFWDVIPDELAAVVVVLARLESGKLSTSLVPVARRR